MGCNGIRCWLLVLLLGSLPAAAFDIDREKAVQWAVELPSVDVSGLDYATLRAEVAYGAVSLGEPRLKTAKTWCVPKGSDNRIRDAVELPTYYYEVPFRVKAGVVVVRDGKGAVVFTSSLAPLESYERFGHGDCRYWIKKTLQDDYRIRSGDLVPQARQSAREYFERTAAEAIDDALFLKILEEKVSVYTFKDKIRGYEDLNEAARLARTAYGAMEPSVAGPDDAVRERLQSAIAIWEAALGESDLNDKTARINRKVTVRLHESIGAALLALDDPSGAVEHLEKADRYSLMTMSRADGSGAMDLLQRARRRKLHRVKNVELPSGEALEALVRESARHRGRVPIAVLPPTALDRLSADHAAQFGEALAEAVAVEREERERAIATGRENPYERQVGQSAAQGFFLFLMPYPEKLQSFPSEICELTHLNRLRVPNHEFDTVPEQIAQLEALEVLDLSGNRISSLPAEIGDLGGLKKLDLSRNRLESLPESIGRLRSLKVLELKGNPLGDDEVERIKRLLPSCKVKA